MPGVPGPRYRGKLCRSIIVGWSLGLPSEETEQKPQGLLKPRKQAGEWLPGEGGNFSNKNVPLPEW